LSQAEALAEHPHTHEALHYSQIAGRRPSTLMLALRPPPTVPQMPLVPEEGEEFARLQGKRPPSPEGGEGLSPRSARERRGKGNTDLLRCHFVLKIIFFYQGRLGTNIRKALTNESHCVFLP
jgi:hypothetical protein